MHSQHFFLLCSRNKTTGRGLHWRSRLCAPGLCLHFKQKQQKPTVSIRLFPDMRYMLWKGFKRRRMCQSFLYNFTFQLWAGSISCPGGKSWIWTWTTQTKPSQGCKWAIPNPGAQSKNAPAPSDAHRSAETLHPLNVLKWHSPKQQEEEEEEAHLWLAVFLIFYFPIFLFPHLPWSSEWNGPLLLFE